ncbi:MAG TPA: hypothetical protein VFQ12_08435, partial [Thermoleophilaceae bacterium]|nr:hypothetical protein [Thermoleophilaceae bacterium]
MEAATPLRQARVGIVGDRLVVHDLDVQDECSVRLVREREQAGEDPVKAVRDAIEVGARILDREQAAANAEYVKTEFERASRELDVQDECAVRLVREREQAGDDPAKTVRDALVIGARVLDREQAAANSE